MGSEMCIRDRFNPDTYAEQKTFEQKIHYITNVNPARNFCIERGFDEGADFVLPFDGNCFFRPEAWFALRNAIIQNYNSPYFLVPMSRCKNYDDVNRPPQTQEMFSLGSVKRLSGTEPQIVFGKDHDIRFNNEFRYAEASKVELLWKLAVPGIWDYWYPELHRQAMLNPSKYAQNNIIYGGYVCRLPSGNSQAEVCNVQRGADRQQGMINIVNAADGLLV